jgi:hypothetical protein
MKKLLLSTAAFAAVLLPINAATQYSSQYLVDVKSGANGCAAASGTGEDDTTAIQCQLNYMYNLYNAGSVVIPCGGFLVSNGGLLVQGGVSLVGGCGQNGSVIYSNTESAVVSFDPNTCQRGGGMYGLSVVGFQGSTSTNTVTVGLNCPTILRDNTIWFGASGLFTEGVDGHYQNNFFSGNIAAVTSYGANWYEGHNKFDTNGQHTTYAFYQGPYAVGGVVVENHFTDPDFSGDYDYSIYVDDGGQNSAKIICTGCILGATVNIVSGKATIITAGEVGSINSNAPIIITGSQADTPVTVTGPGQRSCAGNININC